jgi:hypothetical protein
VSTWAALKNATGSCVSKCSYVLTKDFTTPLQGFKHIRLGDHGEGAIDDDHDTKDPVLIIIDGKGVAIIDARGQDRMFTIHGGSTLSITGVTLQNGHAVYGGAIEATGHLNATDCAFKKNKAVNGGGALQVSGSSNSFITGCTSNGNTAYGGGAVSVGGVPGSSGTIISCTFIGGAPYTDSVDECVGGGGSSTTTFACPSTSTGTPVVIPKVMGKCNEFNASQLPPAKEVVHCTPKVPQ